jgi:hypothetical protein
LNPSSSLWTVAAFTLLVNLPFGFWRAGVRRFSGNWFLAVHGPVPLVVGFRLLVGVAWRVQLVPFFVAAYFAGQFLGGHARRHRETSGTGWGKGPVDSP